MVVVAKRMAPDISVEVGCRRLRQRIGSWTNFRGIYVMMMMVLMMPEKLAEKILSMTMMVLLPFE